MMTATRTGALIAVVAIGAITLMLVGGTDDAARPDGEGVLEIALHDYGFEPDPLRLPTGEPLTLRFVNQDDPSHHVSFGREVREHDGRAVGFDEDLFAGLEPRVTPPAAQTGPSADDPGFEVLVRGHETVTLEVTLPPDRTGSWEIGCFTGRGCHYRAGLAGTVIVE